MFSKTRTASKALLMFTVCISSFPTSSTWERSRTMIALLEHYYDHVPTGSYMITLDDARKPDLEE